MRMQVLKLNREESKQLTYTLRSKTMTLQEQGQNEAAYWDLRDFMVNLPPSNVYKWSKSLDDAWHVARAACKEYEFRRIKSFRSAS